MKCCKEEVILDSLPVPSSIPASAESNARYIKKAMCWLFLKIQSSDWHKATNLFTIYCIGKQILQQLSQGSYLENE